MIHMSNPFEKKGKWLKGNLHCHTTESDGRLSPAKVVEKYRNQGYRFLAITDHNKITKVEENDIILIPGVEVSISGSEYDSSFHVVVLGLEDYERIDNLKNQGLDDLFDYVFSMNGYAFVAHPYWSSLTFRDLSDIEKLQAIEVFNATCDLIGKGYSSVYWDALLAQGKKIGGLAVDDAHRYDLPPTDSLKGWIWLKVEEISYKEVLDSLKKGLYYASTGPEFYSFGIKDGYIKASFSPVYRVNLITRNGRGASINIGDLELFSNNKYEELELEIYKEDNEDVFEIGRYNIVIKKKSSGICYISAPLSIFRIYSRIEIIDVLGRYAWTNPLFIQ